MTPVLAWIAASLAIAGCSDLADSGSGVVALEVRIPANTRVEVGDTVQLQARALNSDGDSVAAVIIWRATPDTVLAIDSLTGLLTALQVGNGTGTVQASTDGLTSNQIDFTVLARVDTLVIRGPDTLRVAAGAGISPPLDARLETISPPGGVGGRTIVFSIVQPIFGVPGDSVQLNGNGNTVAAVTGADGSPSTPVVVETIPGSGVPDSVFVQIEATRPSGALIPGSGQQFIIRFD